MEADGRMAQDCVAMEVSSGTNRQKSIGILVKIREYPIELVVPASREP